MLWVGLPHLYVVGRAATFTKFGKRLHEFQLPKLFRLHVTSRFFFHMQLRKIANIFHKKPFEKCTLCEYSKLFLVGCCDRTHFK